MFTLFVTVTTFVYGGNYVPQTQSYVRTYPTMIECRAAASAYRTLQYDGPRGQRLVQAECVG